MQRKYTTLPYTEYTTADGRFDSNRSAINLIVLHSTAGSLASAVSLFGSTPPAGKETSAHYIIDNQGNLHAGLEEYLVAYHCGNYSKNQSSIGIEHVDEGADKKIHTDAQYNLSYKLVADICKFYNIPCDAAHIVPHSSITATACPNGLDVTRIINGANAILGGAQPPTTDNCQAELAVVTADRNRLNDIIGKVKDPQIAALQKEIADLKAKDSNYEALVSEKNGLAVQLSECQKTSTIYKAEYDNANAPDGYKAQIVHLVDQKLALEKDITTLQTKAGYWETKFNNTKKPVQKLIIAIAEKLGIQI